MCGWFDTCPKISFHANLTATVLQICRVFAYLSNLKSMKMQLKSFLSISECKRNPNYTLTALKKVYLFFRIVRKKLLITGAKLSYFMWVSLMAFNLNPVYQSGRKWVVIFYQDKVVKDRTKTKCTTCLITDFRVQDWINRKKSKYSIENWKIYILILAKNWWVNTSFQILYLEHCSKQQRSRSLHTSSDILIRLFRYLLHCSKKKYYFSETMQWAPP